MLSNVLETIQEEFKKNWVGVVHYGSSPFKGSAESWIHIDVEAIHNETLSYSGCVAEEHALYVTAYHRNELQAAKLADEVISFIQQRQLGSLYTRTWRPGIKGMMDDGKAFYKLSIPINIIN